MFGPVLHNRVAHVWLQAAAFRRSSREFLDNRFPFHGNKSFFNFFFFLNGSSVLPYMTRPPPGLGTPLGQVTVFRG